MVPAKAPDQIVCWRLWLTAVGSEDVATNADFGGPESLYLRDSPRDIVFYNTTTILNTAVKAPSARLVTVTP
ncbi:hypothetical protein QO002_005609 [Pararhizobium capsulatum DSM 1112]|uniref:Uncharacterized protein n=1 Tax=Pararhizobium capsulatum DSM 1112 TaxID=1121113 RepID=A0ABU0BYQ7_9HYPH|nr:hypothetical protein [Pararhizobium capsulatum DSM 1112]